MIEARKMRNPMVAIRSCVGKAIMAAVPARVPAIRPVHAQPRSCQ